MTTISYINLSLELWGCVMCGLVMLCLMLSSRPRNKCDKLYLRMLLCNMGALLFDGVAYLLRGHPGQLCWWGVRISNFVAFSMNYALLQCFAHYLTEYLSQYTEVSHRTLHIARGVCLTCMIMLAFTQFFPVIYTIDRQNIYHRAGAFWLSMALCFTVIIACGQMLVHYRRFIRAQERLGLWIYIVLPLAAILVQTLVYGLVISNMANTVSLVIIFLFLQVEQGRQAEEQKRLVAEQKNELMQSRVAIMLSQIQPHFLYNALAAIQDMCHGKAPEAEQATIQFAEFLRGNLDSLQADSPIPFSQELKHTKNYLWLEQQRFEERLRVEYDIQVENFRVPALTLQPIVENAVRYGVTKKEHGGTVWVSSRKTDDAFVITVKDDGVGFDAYAPKTDGRTHIGITNVADRLRAMCGGSLTIDSTLGQGTTAVISIPRDQPDNT